AKEQTNGMRPDSARPAAMPMAFCSAMPTLNARPGYLLAKLAVIVDFDRSASTVTMRSSRAPSSSNASPKAARVALAGMGGSLLCVEGAELRDDRGRRPILGEVLVPGRATDAEQLANGGDRLRRLGRLAVPLGVVLHERDALALDGVGDDERRAARPGLRLIERLADLIDVVAVDLDHRPAECLPLLDERLEIEDLPHEVVELNAVFIEDHGEVAEAMAGLPELRSGHCRLPHLTFLDLSVADDAVHAIRLAAETKAECHPQGNREALAKRARGCFDAGQHRPIGMTLERAAELAQGDQALLGKVPRACHRRVHRGHRVAFGEDEAIALGPVGTLGIVTHAAEHDRHDEVDDRQRAAGMTGARVGQHADDLHAALARDRRQTAVWHQGRSSMKPAMASTRTPETAISGA